MKRRIAIVALLVILPALAVLGYSETRGGDAAEQPTEIKQCWHDWGEQGGPQYSESVPCR